MKPMPASNALHDRDADHALRHGADGRAREPQEMLALFGHDAKQETAAGRNQPRPVRKQEAGHEHRDQELERADAGIARERQERSRQRLEIRRHLAEHCADVVVGLLPEVE
ncbi:hypothetical protein ACVWZ6_005697 [Bradyrhizobium sp. GM6.1]